MIFEILAFPRPYTWESKLTEDVSIPRSRLISHKLIPFSIVYI